MTTYAVTENRMARGMATLLPVARTPTWVSSSRLTVPRMGLLSPLATPTDAAVASGVMTAVGANRARCAVVTNVCVAPLSRMASPSGSLPFGWLKSEGVKRNVRRGSLGRLARAVYAAYAAAKYVAGTGLSSGSSPRKRQQL